MSLTDALQRRGVVLHDPSSCTFTNIDPDRFEPGVEIFPCTHLVGPTTAVGRGSKLGITGGTRIEHTVIGRNVTLHSGFFHHAVLHDDCVLRGHAELRGGTVLEEGCEAAHHVGYKNTFMTPWTVAGSLVNFCDALFAGGRSRADHGEIGSCLALYNYTPWGDKFASRFGNVLQGLLLRADRVFIGGQTQIVSPVLVGEGVVVPAGLSVRRNIPPHRIHGDIPIAVDAPFDPLRIGAITPKLHATADIVAHLHAIEYWYSTVRRAWAGSDPLRLALVSHSLHQLASHRTERTQRLASFLQRLDASLVSWESSSHPRRDARIAEHRAWLRHAPTFLSHLHAPPPPAPSPPVLPFPTTYTQDILTLPPPTVLTLQNHLTTIVAAYTNDSLFP
jgi:hypothetical protein